MIKIANLSLKSPVIVAPMAGVTDISYRKICKMAGAALLCTEMVSAKAILYNNRNTSELLKRDPDESPLSIQLFGSDPEIMANIGERVSKDFEIVDVNMGCPVPKVVKNGEGSALMKNPDLAYDILSNMVKKIKKPVSVKFRKGFNDESINAVEFAKMAESAGVSMITVHGRTREEYYSGKADWDILRKVKEAVNIPVFGNGDIFTPEDAKRMMDETGVDGVALARGVKGNPWLIKRTVHLLTKGELMPEPDVEEIKRVIKLHASLMLQDKGEFTSSRELRKHISWYTKGLKNSAAIRDRVNHCESMDQILSLIDEEII